MEKNTRKKVATQKPQSKSKNKAMLAANIFLAVFEFICILCLISLKTASMILPTIGIALLLVTLNFAYRYEVTRKNAKKIAILSLVLTAISVPFLLKLVIVTYILAVPSMILGYKALNQDKKDKITFISFVVPAGVFVAGIISSIVGLIKAL